MAWIRVPLLSFCWYSYKKYSFLYFENLHMVSSTIINAIDPKAYKQDGRVEWGAGFRHQSLLSWGSSPTPVILLTFLKKVLFPLFLTPAYCVMYHYPCYWPQKIQARRQCGLRCWFKAPVTSLAWVRVQLLSFWWNSYTKYCFPYFDHLHMVSSTIIDAIDLKTYRQDGRVEWGAYLRHQSLRWRGVESYSCHFVDIPKWNLLSFILNTYT